MRKIGSAERNITRVRKPFKDRAYNQLLSLLPFSSSTRQQKQTDSFFAVVYREFQGLFIFFKVKGFLHTMMAFALAEAIGNCYASSMNGQLMPLGYDAAFISIAGVLFIAAVVVGSAVVGGLVDKFGHYKLSLVICLLVVGVLQLLITFQVQQKDPPAKWAILVSVIGLGFFLGPVQPVALECAAECTYPSSETAFTAVMQIFGNVFSAVLVPLLNFLQGLF
jgi:MFS family permease